ncbi:MAG: glycerol-3-phosphate 1-O-acyltransferase PlsY [Lachnospiraceae bacterium]|nr:glycerol-3-phosphate 1-O-acyltransferase PlsY [Lachnospiraceae bacterium]
MSILVRTACVGIGYIFGLFQTAYIYGKLNGFDLKDSGSGNYGTTNMLRTKGAKAGLLVFLGDSFKCVFAVLLVYALFHTAHAEVFPLLKVYTAAGTVLGHNFPFYMGFKGGKGIAATAGLILVMGWEFVLPELLLFALIFGITHYVSLGSLCIYVYLFAQIAVMGQLSYGQFAPMDPASKIEMYIVVFLLVIMAFVRHRENIKRLISGTERKTYLKKKSES